jgi:hypothetical protein
MQGMQRERLKVYLKVKEGGRFDHSCSCCFSSSTSRRQEHVVDTRHIRPGIRAPFFQNQVYSLGRVSRYLQNGMES